MRLTAARVQKYRSVIDSGWFDVERDKTILVGPNEAGKTVLLQALQHLNAPPGVRKLDPLRDYPRGLFNEIDKGKVNPADVAVVAARFELSPEDQAQIPEAFRDCVYVLERRLDNTYSHYFENSPSHPTIGDIKKDLVRLASRSDSNVAVPEGEPASTKFTNEITTLIAGADDQTPLTVAQGEKIGAWLTRILPHLQESGDDEKRYDKLEAAAAFPIKEKAALDTLYSLRPLFVLFSNYFRVRPLIHLGQLADRIDGKTLVDEFYDYGNLRLLKLLGFTARELSDLGKVAEPAPANTEAFEKYRHQLDTRAYKLNAAEVRLTQEINRVWAPDPTRAEANKLKIRADQQYLKVVVEDELGVEIELDQRSEGYQWLVSFFIVFFADAADQHANAILLLDEPGLSLHGLKQRQFRDTVSRLAETNQTLYTTHSPFLVGPDELDRVRVVEMTDRRKGTKVHTDVLAEDPAALLPLQEALGYDLAQSLFGQQRNLVLEGLTDLWYVEAVAELLRASGTPSLSEKIAMVPAKTAGKVVYYATILHSQKLKVAALLDSDSAGDQAAQQEILVHTLGNKAILRTKDAYSGPVATPEIEDMLRDTLVAAAQKDLGWDVSTSASSHPKRPIIDIFEKEIAEFSKYKLAKAFIRWTRAHEASDLAGNERKQWEELFKRINAALR